MSSTTEETFIAKSDDLRMWLFMSGAFDVCFFLVLTSVDKPMSVIGIMLLIHLVFSLPVFYAFHRTAVIEAVLKCQSGGDYIVAFEPPFGGACGRGGGSMAFLLYAVSFALHTHRLSVIYTTCAFNTYKLHLDAISYLEIIGAFVALLFAIFFVEMGKRARSSNSYV